MERTIRRIIKRDSSYIYVVFQSMIVYSTLETLRSSTVIVHETY